MPNFFDGTINRAESARRHLERFHLARTAKQAWQESLAPSARVDRLKLSEVGNPFPIANGRFSRDPSDEDARPGRGVGKGFPIYGDARS
jgi:hypothetical protein